MGVFVLSAPVDTDIPPLLIDTNATTTTTNVTCFPEVQLTPDEEQKIRQEFAEARAQTWKLWKSAAYKQQITDADKLEQYLTIPLPLLRSSPDRMREIRRELRKEQAPIHDAEDTAAAYKLQLRTENVFSIPMALQPG
ncbi:uncharacterized protein LOC129585364 [Paramacrobiotus metropolitanus]|uniref:uncharacterized protein LOC129585364 n=1 Tax=Paramacrobiotus metropolitanus TaxID=2943436 RepID=UPI00244653AD|nr:uncharacterized protein LOC129585364 [Paramacrobiotus metropolitanus]